MKALILAAGYATRLYPLTKEYPKPLLPVGEKPIISYILEKLQEIKVINGIIVITNSRFFDKFKEWRQGLSFGQQITVIDDLTRDNATRRGAIGDMDFAIDKEKINEDLLVIGGDNLFDSGLKGFLSFVKKNQGSPVIGAYDIKDKTRAVNYGVLKLDKVNRVTDFQEKPSKPNSSFVAMCLYYIPKQNLGLIKQYREISGQKADATGFYIDWLRKKVTVYGFVFGGKWFDIGDYKFYDEAKETFVKKERGS